MPILTAFECLQEPEAGIEGVESLYFLFIRLSKVKGLKILQSQGLESQVCLFVPLNSLKIPTPKLCEQLDFS